MTLHTLLFHPILVILTQKKVLHTIFFFFRATMSGTVVGPRATQQSPQSCEASTRYFAVSALMRAMQ